MVTNFVVIIHYVRQEVTYFKRTLHAHLTLVYNENRNNYCKVFNCNTIVTDKTKRDAS
jgi:CTP:phosphocholine cytidylyltransferase-like protein